MFTRSCDRKNVPFLIQNVKRRKRDKVIHPTATLSCEGKGVTAKISQGKERKITKYPRASLILLLPLLLLPSHFFWFVLPVRGLFNNHGRSIIESQVSTQLPYHLQNGKVACGNDSQSFCRIYNREVSF